MQRCQEESDDHKDGGSLVPNEVSEMEPFPAESQDDMSEDDDCVTRVNTQKGRSRRKHHMLWTLSEVMKLIEGISRYGVGRWTEIKRVLFSTSTHRTSVDLKVLPLSVQFLYLLDSTFVILQDLIFGIQPGGFQDKWRNLLRASCTRLHNEREVGLKQVSFCCFTNFFLGPFKIYT